MYEKEQELINKIEVDQEAKDSKGEKLKVKAMLNEEEIADLCSIANYLHVSTEKGWVFWYEHLTEDEFFKYYWFMSMCTKSDKLEIMTRIACSLTVSILDTMLVVPCKISLEEEENGYLEAVEQNLDFYLDQDRFDKAHRRCHRLFDRLENTESLGGFVNKINVN